MMSPIEAMTMFARVEKVLAFPGPVFRAGSFRRGSLIINDIDLVVIDSFVVQQRLASIFGRTVKHKPRTNGELFGIHVDVMPTKRESLGSALMHLTGSKDFNIRCRSQAKKLGLKLNQYGLFDGERRVCDCSEELPIFKALGIPWLEPQDRAF